MEIVFRCSRAANSAVRGRIGPNFKLIRDFVAVLVFCKKEEAQIKNEGARVQTTLYINFSDAHVQLTLQSVVVEILTHPVLLTCRIKKTQTKMKALEC